MISSEWLTRYGVFGIQCIDFICGEFGIVDIHPSALDFTGCEVPVFIALTDIVFVNWLAKVSDVIGCNLFVGLDFWGVFAGFKLSGRGGQTDLGGFWIARQDHGPFAPGGSVAFVDDDVRKVIFGVVGGEEVCF